MIFVTQHSVLVVMGVRVQYDCTNHHEIINRPKTEKEGDGPVIQNYDTLVISLRGRLSLQFWVPPSRRCRGYAWDQKRCVVYLMDSHGYSL